MNELEDRHKRLNAICDTITRMRKEDNGGPTSWIFQEPTWPWQLTTAKATIETPWTTIDIVLSGVELTASFTYSDPSPGDVRKMVFDASHEVGDGEIAFSINSIA